jgi:TonB family protein
VPTGSPFFPDLSPPPLRAMLAISGVAHVGLVIVALAFPSLSGTPVRLEPVAVVDLIGGGEFLKDAEKAPGPPPQLAREKEEPPKGGKASKIPPAPLGKTTKSPPARKGGAPAAEPDEFTSSKRRASDTASLTERLRKMREARAGSDAVREAVEERRTESAARAAVRSVGERVAHRIEAPAPTRSGARGAAGGGGGGAQGTVRLSPELLDYFRRLEERVRSSWVLPEALVRDAAKLVVELRIVIEKDGRVSAERIERGSGNPYFDDSVRRAIRKASPLPVPPEQLRGGEDHYEVGFRFHGGAG